MLISVVTTSYNYDKYIAETIESVLNQTYSDFEYIIFDDGSTDNSIEIIEKYSKKDSRIKFFTHEGNKNKGLIATMQAAIQKCKGDWIVFVESDDIIVRDYLKEKIDAVKKYPDAAVIFNDIRFIGNTKCERAEKMHSWRENQMKLIRLKEFDYYHLFTTNLICTFSAVMIGKDIISSVPFNFPISHCIDWYLWNRLLLRYNFVYIDKKLTDFRIHDISYSTKKYSLNFANEILKYDKNYFMNTDKKYIYKITKYILERKYLEKIFRPQYNKLKNYLLKKVYSSYKVKLTVI